MEKMVFVCPGCGSKVEPGVMSDLETLLRIRDKRVRDFCPHCRVTREWRVCDAELQRAA